MVLVVHRVSGGAVYRGRDELLGELSEQVPSQDRDFGVLYGGEQFCRVFTELIVGWIDAFSIACSRCYVFKARKLMRG